MKRSIALYIAIAAAIPAHAGPSRAMTESERRAASTRPVAVSLYQRLETSVDVGRVAADTGGGLIGAIIVASMDDKRDILTANANNRASATIEPLATALAGKDFSRLAEETTRKALAATSWFRASTVALVPAPGLPSREALFGANPSDQVGIVTYRYQMSPDFTQLRVIADVGIARSTGLSPIYSQRIVSLVELNHRSYNHDENVARWSSNNGAVAEQAIAAAFARLEVVMPAILELSPAKFTAVTDKAKTGSAFAAGFYGPQFMRDGKGVVIWSKGSGFVAAQSASD